MRHETNIIKYQRAVLETLSGKIDDFYLAGGTALSLFYFNHRLSVDLDFFTRDFSEARVKKVMDNIKNAHKAKIGLIGQSAKKERARIMVYNVHFPSWVLKIDFVEDFIDIIEKPKMVNGIKIMSLQDIYMRKVYAVSGMRRTTDITGKEKFIGGRAEAKDFYDLYFLSHTYMPLSKFIERHYTALLAESLVQWFRTYDRMSIIDGLLEIMTDKKMDYREMERHFKVEIARIIEKRLGDI